MPLHLHLHHQTRIKSDAASFEIPRVVIKSDVFPMLLHYKTDGDRLSLTGRMAGGDRGSQTLLLLWLVNGHVLRTGIDRVPVEA